MLVVLVVPIVLGEFIVPVVLVVLIVFAMLIVLVVSIVLVVFVVPPVLVAIVVPVVLVVHDVLVVLAVEYDLHYVLDRGNYNRGGALRKLYFDDAMAGVQNATEQSRLLAERKLPP